MKTINIALAAHVDSGKTTLAEQILFQTGTLLKAGDVNKGSSRLDWTEIERKRGITVFAEQAFVNWRGSKINIIDTPGHTDFYTELERSLSVADIAVILISAADGIQQNTERIWELVCKRGIPAIFFLNKMDRIGADHKKTAAEIQKQLSSNAILFQDTEKIEADFAEVVELLQGNNCNSEFIELIAEKDEFILEKYLNGTEITREELLLALQRLFTGREIFPILLGAASKGIGVSNLLDYAVDFVQSEEDQNIINAEGFRARIYKIRHDSKAGRLAYVKVLHGQIKVKDSVVLDDKIYKINQIRLYSGPKFISADYLSAGDLGVISGLDTVKAGDIISQNELFNEDFELKPILLTRIELEKEEDYPVLLKAMEVLEAENPLLAAEISGSNKEISIQVMGLVQMEILEEIFSERFGLQIKLSKPHVMYSETVTSISKGFCHFEPKKHYAEVEVELLPNERGKGNEFQSIVSTDKFPLQYQTIVRKTVDEALKRGALANLPVQDVIVRLTAGRHHLEHTHGGDFRIATIRAIQQALENNELILLEPIMEFTISVHNDFAGRVMSDILKMNGEYLGTDIKDSEVTVRGFLPASTSLDYPLELAGFTGGTGRISMKYHGFKECHNEEEILSNIEAEEERLYENKDTNEDILYNSVSLFRAKRKMKKVTNNAKI